MAVSRVQTLGSQNNGTGTSHVLTTSATQTAGNLVVLFTAWENTLSNPTITDSGGNPDWVLRIKKNAANKSCGIYVSQGNTALPSGATITASHSASTNGVMFAAEYAGVSTNTDGTGNAIGASGDAAVTWTPGTTGDLALCIVFSIAAPADFSTPTGWADQNNVGFSGGLWTMETFDLLGITAGARTDTATASLGLSGWTMITTALKEPTPGNLRTVTGAGR